MSIKYRDGLLFTSIEILYKGKTKLIENIVIDTGASHSLISQDCVDEIGIKVEADDAIVTSYGIGGKEHAFVKKVDRMSVNGYSIEGCRLDFTNIEYEDINGLLGLDILLTAGFLLDLKNLEMYLHK